MWAIFLTESTNLTVIRTFIHQERINFVGKIHGYPGFAVVSHSSSSSLHYLPCWCCWPKSWKESKGKRSEKINEKLKDVETWRCSINFITLKKFWFTLSILEMVIFVDLIGEILTEFNQIIHHF